MNKREIINWLECKKDNALVANETYYDEAGWQEEEKLLRETDFFTMTNKMQQFLEKAVQTWDDWAALQAGNPLMQINRGYCYFLRELRSVSKEPNGVSKCLRKNAIQFQSGRFDELFNERKDTHNKIAGSYQKVIDAVLKSRSAKEAMEFIASLGFDLAEIARDLAPTVSGLEIDTTYLFPEKVNKDERQNAA